MVPQEGLLASRPTARPWSPQHALGASITLGFVAGSVLVDEASQSVLPTSGQLGHLLGVSRLDTPLSKFREEVVSLAEGRCRIIPGRLPDLLPDGAIYQLWGLDTCLMLGTRSPSVS